MKYFNLLLGAGFSKALADIPTGQELSREFFDKFSQSDNEEEKNLANFNYETYETYMHTGTGDSDLFAGAPPIYDFWTENIIFPKLKMPEALQRIEQSNFIATERRELEKLIKERFQDNFNYEMVAKHLTNLLESSEIFNIDSDRVRSLSGILNKIKKRVFDITTATPISWSLNEDNEPQALNDFIFFLKYLLDQGYTINIFDLNHDQLIREVIKTANLSEGYQDFFNREDIVNVYQSELKAYKFEDSLSKKRINHYKLHGDFQIIWDHYYGWVLLSEFSTANKYTWSADEYASLSLLTDSLLFEGDAKPNSIFSSAYHSFAFANFFKSVQNDEAIMIIGYGGGDRHINAILDVSVDNKVLLRCNEDTEAIIKDSLLCFDALYPFFSSGEDFEKAFLPDFRKKYKNRYHFLN